MKKPSDHYISTVIFILLTSLITTLAQSRIPKGVISGFVIEASHQKPVEYANVVLYSQKNKEQITGTITDKNGYFRLSELRHGMYLLEIKFIGYKAFSMDSLLIRPNHNFINLGRIAINPDVLVMSGVEILGEKPIIEFKIDKKIINVSKQFTSLSGTAVDVLENVPSVSVDIEGNVSLRGSGSFNLLIDGRPSILDPNDALQAIPASTIENIEIVTNPSARFDPDGVAGIINIITKKNKLHGFSGISNLNAGLYSQYGGDFLLNFRKNRYNFYIAANVNHRNMPGEMLFNTRTFIGDTTSLLNSNGESKWGGTSDGIRGGLDFNLSTADLLSFSFRYGSRSHSRSSEMEFKKWTNPGDSINYYTSINSSDRSGNFYSLNLDYRHNFKKEGHKLSSQINLRRRDMEEDSRNELLDVYNQVNSGQRSTEAGPGTRLRCKLDYVLPVNKDDRIEAGYQLRYGLSEDENSMYKWKPDSGNYVFQSDFSHSTDYTRNIQSTYLIYAGQLGAFGYQGGLRGEYTYRFIELVGIDSTFSIDRWDVYPTFHTSFQFGGGQQLMASYTRRIRRARGWQLEPFITWMDAYNVRKGNPDLKPQFIDSYEAGYQKTFGRSLLSIEAYYRVTHNKVERVRSIYDRDIILHTTDNVGEDYALGTELMLTLFPFKWWNLNLMGNLFDYRVEGELNNVSFDQQSFNWSTRINNTFKLGKSTRIQLSAMYHSPSVSSQGRNEGYFFTNAAVRQDFWNRKLSATLQLRDILGTAEHEFTSEGPGFYSYNKFSRQPRILSFTLTYNINNY
ncbi:MAG: hypothetical protein DRP89_06760, partial [Candidatus Neomarinimicrobiota bacterium]